MNKNRKLISGDAQLANFREIRMGGIAPGTLYRSSHPIKDYVQEKTIALLADEARIAAVINLADTDSEIGKKAFFAPWYNHLYKNNRVIGLGMDFNNAGDIFGKKLKKGLQFIINTEGPWLIHCYAGFDRTGYVSIILEALMGATLDEIIDDYLLSFNSMFNSSIYSDHSKKTDSAAVLQLLSIMGTNLPINDQNLPIIAEQYLRNAVALSVDEVNLLKAKLSKKA